MKMRPDFIRNSRFARIVVALIIVLVGSGFGAGGASAEGVASPQQGPAAARTYKWIDVDLSSQTLSAYQGSSRVWSTRVSTGTAKHPTVKGTFRVYTKLVSTRMRGGTGSERYDLPNVPHTMYFFGNYGIHGTYWHNNFGRPMSHGCVNLSRAAAKWLFNWTPVGTSVVVHQ